MVDTLKRPRTAHKPKTDAKAKVVAVDHMVIRVGDYKKSKQFYSRLFEFLGFDVMDEYADMMGWRNDVTRFWIAAAKPGARKFHEGDVGFHHYAFELRGRQDIDNLQSFLHDMGAEIVDPAGEYYEDYYAVYFRDPDGMKLEAMTYGAGHPDA
ncbi:MULTISPECIES: VOC family protein [Rhodomicrobium]|uniref:VOC family protein n=1 Tax=Rhodomicrobium TaxID=1068 RepID=UPI000B4A6E95|nr:MULTISPECIES: VOC family protein [Rhodomicrobium]